MTPLFKLPKLEEPTSASWRFLETEALFIPQFRISLISVSKLAVRNSMRTIFVGNGGSILDFNSRTLLKVLNNGQYLASSGYESLPVPRAYDTQAEKAFFIKAQAKRSHGCYRHHQQQQHQITPTNIDKLNEPLQIHFIYGRGVLRI